MSLKPSLNCVHFRLMMDDCSQEVKIDKAYIANVVGDDNLQAYLNLAEISDAILFYVIPWVATIAVVANILVALPCGIIYLKTKKKNHKPAFVFIGFLALIDVILARYVECIIVSEICFFLSLQLFSFGNPHHHHHIEETVCRTFLYTYTFYLHYILFAGEHL